MYLLFKSGRPMDGTTTLQALRNRVTRFRDERDWLKFDTPRSMAISISVEAAELLEHFQWKTDEEILQALKDEARIGQVSDELADVIIYCLGFSDVLGIDVSEAVEKKLKKSSERYPAVEPRLAA